MDQPVTDAGRALLRAGAEMDCVPADDWFGLILEVERQAAERERIRIAEEVDLMPTARIISQWDLISRKAVLVLLGANMSSAKVFGGIELGQWQRPRVPRREHRPGPDARDRAGVPRCLRTRVRMG